MLVEPQIQTAEIERSRRNDREASPPTICIFGHCQSSTRETEQEHREAHALLSEALMLEPDNGPVLAAASRALGHRSSMGWPAIGPNDRELSAQLARRGIRNAAGDARVMAQCGNSLIHAARDYELGMAAVRWALDANPNSMQVIINAGIAHLHCGDVEEALACFHRAQRLSPRDPAAHFPLTGIAHAQMILGDYAEAIVWATRSLVVNPSFDPTYWMLIAANAHLGRMDEAHRLLEQFKKISERHDHAD